MGGIYIAEHFYTSNNIFNSFIQRNVLIIVGATEKNITEKISRKYFVLSWKAPYHLVWTAHGSFMQNEWNQVSNVISS
jgi:hypothetical protein